MSESLRDKNRFSVKRKGLKSLALKGFFTLLAAIPLCQFIALPQLFAFSSTDSIQILIKPRDMWPPYAVTNFAASPGVSEGAVQLQWTAPIEDVIQFPNMDPVTGYTIRYATFSPHDLGDDTTFWFNNATWNFDQYPGMNPGETETPILGGLEPGATLYFIIRSSDDAVPANLSLLSRPTTAQIPDSAPSAPRDLTTLFVNETTATITWLPPLPNPGDLDFYRVFINSSTPEVWSATAAVTAPSTSYSFTTLLPEVTYYFKVSVVDKGQPNYLGNAYESGYSSTMSARLNVTAPSAFTAVSAATETITWQWTDNSWIEDSFRIYSSTGGVMGSTISLSGVGGTMQWTETGLVPGASYQRYAVAVSQGVQSVKSNTGTKYTLANPPLNLVSSTASASSVALSWNNNNNASGTKYILERATYPLVNFIQIAEFTAQTFVSTGLAEYTTYTYQLRAKNGENVETSTITLSTATLMVPPAPVISFSASAGAVEGEVTLRWIAPGDDNTLGNIIGGEYDIRWSTNIITSGTDFLAISTDNAVYSRVSATDTVVGSDQGIFISGLNFGTTIHFAVRIRDEMDGNYSGISNVVSAQLSVSAPSVMTAVSATTATVTWRWRDNSLAEAGFKIFTSTGGMIGSTGAVSGSGSMVQWTETGLTPGTSYQRYVMAYDQAAQSIPSNTASKYTWANRPINLVRSTATVSSITLTWDDNNNGSETRYILERSTYPSITQFTQIADITAKTSISTGLAEYTTYTYRIRSINVEGVETSTLTLSTATAMMPPSRINNLSAAPGKVEGEVGLHWTAPGDDGTIGNIIGGEYDVRWSTNFIQTEEDFNNIPYSSMYRKPISSTNTIAGSDQGILLTGLQFDSIVYFAIKARDEIVNNYSTMSNIAATLVQIDVTSPATVVNLLAVLTSSTSAKLTWTAPGDDGNTNNNSFGNYIVRYRTDLPIADLSLFSSAQDVTSFGSIPQPSSAGVTETVTLSGLSYDTTYYFAMRTRDEVYNLSPLSNVTSVYTPDLLAPGPVQNLTASVNKTIGKRIDLSWKNPTASDLRAVRILINTSGYATGPTDSAGFLQYDLFTSTTLMAPPTTFAHVNLALNVTYYYSVYAFDDEAPSNFSEGMFVSTMPVGSELSAPSRPTNVRGNRSVDGDSYMLTWDAPTTRVTGEPLNPVELSSYTIFRVGSINEAASNPIYIQPVSSPTVWLDTTLYKRFFYYKVRAVNIAGMESADSDLIASDGDVVVMMDDGVSYMKVSGDLMYSFYDRNIALKGSRVASDEGGKTFKSMRVDVNDRLSGELKKGFLFDKPVQVSIGYLVDAAGKVSNGAPAISFSQALPGAAEAPKFFSVYWFNGLQWLKLGTTVDQGNRTANIKTKHTGAYQLRLVQQGLDVQANSVYPRTITPNGDGINDIAFFFFENPTDAPSKGTIYDMKSARVTDVKSSDIFAGNNTVLTWDGRDDSGGVVPGGVYIYKLEIGDKKFTGTVVVAR